MTVGMIGLVVAWLLPAGAANAMVLMVAGVIMLIAAGLTCRRVLRGDWPAKSARGRTRECD